MPKALGKTTDESTELLRNLLIVQLGLAKVPQQNIRTIAGCDMNRVTKIIKQLNLKKKSNRED